MLTRRTGMSVWVNLLDYTAAVLPVTKVDKTIDVVDTNYKPLSDLDKKVQDTCKPILFFLLPFSLRASWWLIRKSQQMIPRSTMVLM